MERTMTQPSRPTAGAAAPGAAAAAQPSRFGGWGGLLMGGLIGAGLASMFGLGAMASVLGFLLQALLIGGVIWLAWSFFARRRAAEPQPVLIRNDRRLGQMPGSPEPRGTTPSGSFQASPAAPVAIAPLALTKDDFDVFEQRLTAIQTAYGGADVDGLSRLLTPEMLSYYAQELDTNAKSGVRNELGSPKLLQGDLSESWSEVSGDYATVAMRYAMTDVTVEVASGRVVKGDRDNPVEVTEVWTFVRPRGGRPDQWELSAVQQTS
jgi:predicted lipid-binding transport protein (Tim44 family)